MNNKHIVIFSHGFGVRKDSRGFFSGLSEIMPEVESILFDYYDIDEINKTINISTVSNQAKRLNDVILKAKKENPDAIIDLICHSQGSIVAAIANPSGIRKTILLAPVFDMSTNERIFKKYASIPGAIINFNGISKIPSSDGFVRLVSSEYIKELMTINAELEYNNLAEKTELIIIEAKDDEVMINIDSKSLSSKLKLISIKGDHYFSGENRSLLYETVRSYII